MTRPPPLGEHYPRWPGERPFKGTRPTNDNPKLGQTSQPSQQKNRKLGCFKVALIGVAVFFGSALLAGIAGVSEETEDAANVETEQTEAPPPEGGVDQSNEAEPDEADQPEAPDGDEPPAEEEPSGPSFPGMQDSDMVSVPGEILYRNGVGYVTAPLRQFSKYGMPVLCATVKIGNRSDKQIDIGYFEWDLQKPNGLIVSPSVVDGGRPTLVGVGELAPGGTVTGDVCFDGDSAALPGEYILLHETFSFFSAKRMAWVNYL